MLFFATGKAGLPQNSCAAGGLADYFVVFFAVLLYVGKLRFAKSAENASYSAKRVSPKI